MPRHPKPENRDNALRKLRGLLSPRGDEAPITQDALAKTIDVPVATIRAIEAGRRLRQLEPNSDVLRKVALVVGAEWDSNLKGWVLVGSNGVFAEEDPITGDWFWIEPDEAGTPFTYEAWKVYRGFIRTPLPDKQKKKDLEFLKVKIDSLFEEIGDRDRFNLLVRIHRFLTECQKDFGLKKLEHFFKVTQPEVVLLSDRETGKITKVLSRYGIEYRPHGYSPGARKLRSINLYARP
jgi:DNA-binding XRE family transcriptional regulator